MSAFTIRSHPDSSTQAVARAELIATDHERKWNALAATDEVV